jgi:hypothetical protein
MPLHACTQVLQWTFAGAPGHPALRDMCDHIVRSAGHVFSKNTNVDTLERTGPGAWTDVVLRHARLHPPAKVGSLHTRCCMRGADCCGVLHPGCPCLCAGAEYHTARGMAVHTAPLLS